MFRGRPCSPHRTRARILSALAIVVAITSAAELALAQPATPTSHAPITPPQVIEHVDAIYPPSDVAGGQDVNVVVAVTVERDGSVSDASIATSGGEVFDNAALTAVRRWRFAPALKEGAAVRARIRVPFHFAPGPHEDAAPARAPASKGPSSPTASQKPGAQRPTPPSTNPAPTPTAPPTTHDAATDVGEGAALPHAVAEEGKPIEIHVQGRPTPPRRGGSDYRFDRQTLSAAPHPSAADLLSVAPGMHVMHTEGEAVAQRVVLRGFDADHGQDVEFSVGGIPINQASHIHGQGYSDLNVIIPETVRGLRVLEGVYDPKQGDFAVAGSVEYDLGVTERGVSLQGSFGSFNTARVVGLWAPAGDPEETFAAASFRRSDGFGGGSRAGVSGAVTGQYRLELKNDLTALIHVAAYAARQRVGGVLRADDIDNQRVDFYDTYSDPSGQGQSASASRVQAGVTVEHVDDDGSTLVSGLWVARTTFLARLNFTGYVERDDAGDAPGDLLEQSNLDTGIGARFAYRTRRFEPAPWAGLQLSMGADGRFDAIEQGQDLIAAPTNATWKPGVDAAVDQVGVGLYGDVLLTASKFARLRAGMRADFGQINIDDRLATAALPDGAPAASPGVRRTGAGLIAGPRASIEIEPLPWLRAHVAYGQGYRSPQALQITDGEPLTFTKVHSYEAGVKLTAAGRASLTASAFETRLSEDLAFEASEGALERIGPTRRRGIAAHVDATPAAGLMTSVSATYVSAALVDTGEALTFVSPFLLRADMSYERPLAVIRGEPLRARVGYGATFSSAQPLPEGLTAPPVFLLDASLSLRRGFLEIGVDAMNLLNARYADTEFVYVSDWHTAPSASPEAARHITAGAPLSVLGHVALYL